MKIKRFIAKNTRLAMQQVREELGSEAVILSNRRVPEGVEVVSAIDYDENLIRRKTKILERNQESQAVSAESNESVIEAPSNPATLQPEMNETHSSVTEYFVEKPTVSKATHSLESRVDPSIGAMKAELQNLRGLLEHQLSGLAWHDLRSRKPMEAELLKRFLMLGLEPKFCRQMAAQIINIMNDSNNFNEIWFEAMDKLAALIPVLHGNPLDGARAIALVGPTGVGKSTTLVKMATEYLLRHSSNDIALLSLDTNRIGASEHLKSYARVLGITARLVSNMDSLKQALEAFYDKKMIFIDTPGASNWDKEMNEPLAILQKNFQCHTFLVLSATQQYSVLNNCIDQFKKRNLKGCILTKVDEAISLGEAISALVQNDLPVAYFTDGPKVPTDLHIAKSQQLVTRTVQVAKGHAYESDNETLALKINGLVEDAQ